MSRNRRTSRKKPLPIGRLRVRKQKQKQKKWKNRRNWDTRKARTYQDYLNSDLWKRIRQRVLERDFYECCLCLGRANQVHHLRYDRATMAGWRLDRMVAMCDHCHRKIEFTRAGRKRTLAQANWELCRLSGVDPKTV